MDGQSWVEHFERQARGDRSNIRYGRNGRKIYVVGTAKIGQEEIQENQPTADIKFVTSTQSGVERAFSTMERQNTSEKGGGEEEKPTKKRRRVRVLHPYHDNRQ